MKRLYLTALGIIALSACAPKNYTMIKFRQNSDMYRVKYDDSGETILKDKSSSFQNGRIDLRKIALNENRRIDEIVMVTHKGRHFFTAEGFANIWEVKPRSDGEYADSYPIAMPEDIGANPALANDENGNGIVVFYDSGSGVKPKFFLFAQKSGPLEMLDVRRVAEQEGRLMKSVAFCKYKDFYLLASEGYKNVWMLKKEGGKYTAKPFALEQAVGARPELAQNSQGKGVD
ncbi:MAG: hypothetical protein NTW04_02990 [Elusimicrobia bacterium]|nr:hypothetical protein [Elusimicrobiota bacterium]